MKFPQVSCPKGFVPSDPAADINNFATLLTELRAGLPSCQDFLKVTTPGGPDQLDKLYSVVGSTVASIADSVDIMTYDFMNGNKTCTHDAPLKSQTVADKPWNGDAAVQTLIKHGIPKQKITIGSPFYGRFQ